MEIPPMDLSRQHKLLEKELKAAFDKVLEDNRYILGERVQEFEKQIAQTVNAKFAVGVSNGTDALLLGLKALNIGPGDEVITSPFSFVASADVIVRAGAKPVFVDINPATYNLSSELVKKAITPKTKAVIAVHIYGLPANIKALQPICHTKGISLIEDCAQALGAQVDGRPVGGWGIIGCFSFFPTKTLGGFGDGGACTTNDAVLSRRIGSLRQHGMRSRYLAEEIGYNFRLDALQAALLLVKLPHLDKWTKSRQKAAKLYDELLEDFPITLPTIPNGRTHVYHQYTIRTENRDRLAEHLKKAGINPVVYYPYPIHLQPAFSFMDLGKGAFPQAEKAAQEVLSLPIFAGIKQEEIKYICENVGKYFGRK